MGCSGSPLLIKIFQFNIMTSGNLHAVTGQVFEISGMLVCSTNTAGCKYYIVSFNLFFPAIRPPDNSTTTLAAIAKDIYFKTVLFWCSGHFLVLREKGI